MGTLWQFLRNCSHRCVRLPAEEGQKYREDNVGSLVKGMNGTKDASHTRESGCVNLFCGEYGGFRRGTRSEALFHTANLDARMAVCGRMTSCAWQTKIYSITVTKLKAQIKKAQQKKQGKGHMDSRNLMRNLNTKAVSTMHCKSWLCGKGSKSPMLEEGAARYRSICLHATVRFDFVPLKRAARYLV